MVALSTLARAGGGLVLAALDLSPLALVVLVILVGTLLEAACTSAPAPANAGQYYTAWNHTKDEEKSLKRT